jgi:hypothetical protein
MISSFIIYWESSPRIGIRLMKPKRKRTKQKSDSRVQVKRSVTVRFKLTELVSRVTKDNRTTEVGFGPPVGKEYW